MAYPEYEYEYLNRIRDHYAMYSGSEKKIADYILKNSQPENAKKIADMSAVQLAKATGTSSATVIRFCRAVGFKGLTELKYYINKGNLSSYRKTRPLTLHDSVSVVRQKIGSINKTAIDDTIALLDDESLTLAVEKLAGADRILTIAEGGSGCSARLAELMFMQISLDCRYLGDSFLQSLYLKELQPNDVILAISHSGRAANTVEYLKHAKERGLYVISITSLVNTLITKYSDLVLYVSSMEQEYFSNTAAARICELNVISILHSALLVQQQGDHVANNEKEVHQLYELNRLQPGR